MRPRIPQDDVSDHIDLRGRIKRLEDALAAAILASVIDPAHLVGDATDLIAPAFAHGWVNFDSDRPAFFYRDRGRVFLGGSIKSGTIGSSAFTLPTGYRPASANGLNFSVESNAAFGVVSINSTGAVTPTVGNNVSFSLSGISFLYV